MVTCAQQVTVAHNFGAWRSVSAAAALESMKPLRPEDCETVAALIRRAFAATAVAVQPPPSALRVTAADIAAHLRGGGGGVVVAGDAACLLWLPQGSALYLSRLAVGPGRRRQGLAVAMLARAELEARRLGLPCMTLSTRLALAGNRRLFERFGFIETGRSAHPGYAEPTSVAFGKPLTGAPPMDDRGI